MSNPYDESSNDGAAERGDGSPSDRPSARRQAERAAEKAAELFRRGRLTEAEAELRRALAVDPTRGELHFNLGLTLEAAGRLEDALRAFRDAAMRLPRRAETRLAEGAILCRLGRYEEAVRPLETATTLSRTSDAAWARLIEARAGLRHFDEAETTYYVAQQHLGRMPHTLVAMGDLQLHQGQFERAAWCFREALSQAPELPRVRGKLGRAIAQGGAADAGLRMYLEELRHHPGDVQMLIECGDLLATQQRVGEAIEKYRRAAEMAPTLALPKARLGMILTAIGRADHAKGELETAYALDPNATLVRTTLAGIRISEAERIHAATEVSALNRLLRTSQRDSEAPPTREELLESALRLLREEVSQRKDLLKTSDTDDLLRLCELFVRCGAADEAMDLLVRAIDLSPATASRPGPHSSPRTESGQDVCDEADSEESEAPDVDSVRLARRLMVLSFLNGRRRRGRGLARRLARIQADAAAACEYNLILDAIELGRLWLARARLRRAKHHHPHDPALRSLRARWWWEFVRRLGRVSR